MLDQMESLMGRAAGGTRAAADRKAPWHAYLRKNKLKTTQQREAIVDAFLQSTGHIGLDELLSSARRKNPSVGLATVYRTVKLLEEAGLAEARQFGQGHTLYEVALDRHHHDHIICKACNFIIEFESEELEELQERIAERQGFGIVSHRHEIFGLCEKARGVPQGFCPADQLKPRR